MKGSPPARPRVVHLRHGGGGLSTSTVKNKCDNKKPHSTTHSTAISKPCSEADVLSDSEPSVIGSFLAIFSFSFFVCLCLLHLAMCWNRIQQFENSLSLTGYGMEQLMAHYYGFDYRNPSETALLRVNTSFYVH